MNQNPPPVGRRWLVIGSLTSGHAISISIIMTIGLMLPDMTADLGLSPLQQGVLGASATLAVLFLNIPTAWIASRFRPWRMAGLGLIVVSGFTFMQGWAPSFLLLLLGRLAMSMAYSQTEAATALLIQQWSTPRQVARTNGLMISGSDIINGLALLMTPFLIDWLGGWRNTMYLWSGLALLSALSWITLGGERQTPEYVERLRSQRGSPLASIFKYKQLWLLGVGMAGGLALESAFNVFWPTLAQQEFGVDPRIVGLGLAMYMFAAAPAELFVVSLSFLQSRQLTVMAVTGIVTMVTHMALLFTDSEILVVLINVFRGFSICYFPVIVTMAYQLPGIRPREVAVGLAFIYTVMNAGAGVGPLVVGGIVQVTGNLQAALFVTTFFSLTLVASALILKPMMARQSTEETALA